MPRHCLQFCALAVFLCGVQLPAVAAQWKCRDGTSHYNVAFDEHSILRTTQGRLGIWIRFIPLGEKDRKSAASEYKEKRYRSHLKYYEIDCVDQTAVLGLTDIFGSARTQLKRLPGSAQEVPIVPGSILDNVAQRVCPVLDVETESPEPLANSGQTEENNFFEVPEISKDTLQRIEKLKMITASHDAPAETWKELGNIYFDTDQPEQAITAYDHALSLKPNDADILNDQGAMYRQTGDFKRALVNFEKAFSIDPHNLESLYNSGYVYGFDLNNIPKALTVWRHYLELESNSDTSRQVQSFIERYGK